MTTAVVQLGIVGLPARAQAATPAAPGVFAKVLDGKMQSSSPPATATSDGAKQRTTSNPGDGANKGNLRASQDAQSSGPNEPSGIGAKKNASRHQNETSPAPTTDSVAIIQNTPAVTALGLGGALVALPTPAANPGNFNVAPVAANQQRNPAGHLDEKSAPTPSSQIQAFAGFSTNAMPALGSFALSGGQNAVGPNDHAASGIDPKGTGHAIGPNSPDALPKEMKSAGQLKAAQLVPGDAATAKDPKSGVAPAQSTNDQTKTETSTANTAMPEDNGLQPAVSAAGTPVAGAANTQAAMDHLPLPSVAKSGAHDPKTEPSSVPTTTSKDRPANSDSTKIGLSVPQPASATFSLPANGKAQENVPSLSRKVGEREAPSPVKAATGRAASQPQSNVKAVGKTGKDDAASQGEADSDGPAQIANASAQSVGASKPQDQASIQHIPLAGNKTAIDSAPRSSSQLPANVEQLRSAVHDADGSETTNPLPGALVNSAKLIERLGHTEMRVGIQAGELGSVDIRTALSKHQFTAEISVERSDLGQALTTELAGLHNRLAEHRLPSPSVTIQEHGSGNSSNLEQRQRDERKASQTSFAGPAGDGSQLAGSSLLSAIAATDADSASGIDIHM